jgi:hypothetical protein
LGCNRCSGGTGQHTNKNRVSGAHTVSYLILELLISCLDAKLFSTLSYW